MQKKDSMLKIKKVMPGYLFLLPAMLFFVAFVLYPLFKAVIISFYNYNGVTSTFVGLSNFTTLLTDEVFTKSILNTVVLVAVAVPITVIFSLLISLAVYNKGEFIRSFTRAAFYIPAVSSIVTLSIVWRWIYNPMFGILNYGTSMFGADPINWLGDKRFALASIAVVLITLSVGQPIILYIASLGNIPVSYFEAADLDGASQWTKLTKIIWPLIKPTSLYIIIITTINSFQTFAIIQLLTGGGPYYATSTIVFQLYQAAFKNDEYGLASAMGIILTVIVVVISIFQYKFVSSDVEY